MSGISALGNEEWARLIREAKKRKKEKEENERHEKWLRERAVNLAKGLGISETEAYELAKEPKTETQIATEFAEREVDEEQATDEEAQRQIEEKRLEEQKIRELKIDTLVEMISAEREKKEAYVKFLEDEKKSSETSEERKQVLSELLKKLRGDNDVK